MYVHPGKSKATEELDRFKGQRENDPSEWRFMS